MHILYLLYRNCIILRYSQSMKWGERMEKWEIALNKFLKQQESEKYVLAAIATGSFVVGNNTNKSDIDVQIILSDEVNWRERGNKYADGFLIEYFPIQLNKFISIQMMI